MARGERVGDYNTPPGAVARKVRLRTEPSDLGIQTYSGGLG